METKLAKSNAERDEEEEMRNTMMAKFAGELKRKMDEEEGRGRGTRKRDKEEEMNTMMAKLAGELKRKRKRDEEEEMNTMLAKFTGESVGEEEEGKRKRGRATP